MIDYSALRVLVAVAQAGSFDRAAVALNVTRSAVSQRIKQLEERFGAALIVRGSPCVATDIGEQLCRHMENVGILEHDLANRLPPSARIDDAQHRTTLSIATNADSLGTWFLEPVADFVTSSRYLLNLSVDDQEHTAEWLQNGKVVAAVSGSATSIPGCRRYSLGALVYYAVASPAFVARYFAEGVIPEALSQAPCLTFNQKDRLQSQWVLQTMGRAINLPTHWLPSTHSFVDASLRGMGWGMNPAPLVKEHLESGRLVELVSDSPLIIPLYWHINRIAADNLTSLTKHVLDVARRTLHQSPV